MRYPRGMTTESVETVKPNPYQPALLYGGIAAVVVGVIVAFFGNSAGQSADRVAQLAATFGNDPNYMAATGDGIGYAWMWFGIALAVLGALALLGLLLLKAARPES